MNIETKQCYKCKEIKSLSEFRQYKSGKNNGLYCSYCNKCRKADNQVYYRLFWRNTYRRIKSRCNYDKKSWYFKRGIKCCIKMSELKELWIRDKAWLLKKPSLDRIDGTKDYTKDNCRYIELEANLKRKRKVLTCNHPSGGYK